MVKRALHGNRLVIPAFNRVGLGCNCCEDIGIPCTVPAGAITSVDENTDFSEFAIVGSLVEYAQNNITFTHPDGDGLAAGAIGNYQLGVDQPEFRPEFQFSTLRSAAVITVSGVATAEAADTNVDMAIAVGNTQAFATVLTVGIQYVLINGVAQYRYFRTDGGTTVILPFPASASAAFELSIELQPNNRSQSTHRATANGVLIYEQIRNHTAVPLCGRGGLACGYGTAEGSPDSDQVIGTVTGWTSDFIPL